MASNIKSNSNGREGDWKCEGCGNRNYAFRSMCNRCKQPRLLMDSKTPPDSKWFPRIGDWICAGCSNNNYASRDKCKKCGEPKEVAAMPATALPGGAYPSSGHYLSKSSGGLVLGSGVPNVSFVNSKGWRAGDWICVCGYHNYSSRAMCKQCNAPASLSSSVSMNNASVSTSFPGLGTKRLASDELGSDWMNKRLNIGDLNSHYMLHHFGSHEDRGRLVIDQSSGLNKGAAGGNVSVPTFRTQFCLQPPLTAMPTVLGKGAKHWRTGDWMCAKCSNHNFASREQCNRCNARKECGTQPVTVS
uniref:RanBP2-type domain-containing protein n=1 Tax=Araucaria cunninghamii TaxID=56994 RepID=A0A0D6R614_ARACU